MLRFFLLAGLIILISGIRAQNLNESINLKTYSVEEGLSQSSVQDIAQDVFGYLWISTGDGLNSFDGRAFTRYYFHSLKPGSEQSNSFRNVISDSIGNLWVGTDRGLLYIERSIDTLVQPFLEIPDLLNRSCLPLFLFEDSVAVLVSGLGIINVNLSNHKFRRIPMKGFMTGLRLAGKTKKEIWYGYYPATLVRVRIGENQNLQVQKYELGIHDFGIYISVIKLSEDRYLLTTSNDLFLFSPQSQKLERLKNQLADFLPENVRFRSAIKDMEGKIWLTSQDKGIFIINKDFSLNRRIHEIFHKNKADELYENITLLFKDMEGNIWLGSDGSGLALYVLKKEGFGLVSEIELEQGDKVTPFVRCFYQDKEDNIWIGTFNNGLICWNRESDTFRQIFLGRTNNYPSSNDVFCMAPMKDDRILVGSFTGLWLLNPQNYQVEKLQKLLPGRSIVKITDILAHGNDLFTILLNNNIYQIVFQNASWQLSAMDLPDSVICDKIAIGQSGYIFAFTRNGFYKLKNGSGIFLSYSYQGQQVRFKVNAAYEYKDGTLWLATDFGLVNMDKAGAVISFYDEEGGLPNHYLYGLMPDESGHFWLSSNRGLSRFELSSKQFTNFRLEDGLQSLEFNSGAFYKTQKGEIFFGGIKGFNFFYPDSVNQKKVNNRVMIRSVRINDQPAIFDTCAMAKRFLDLEYDQNTLTFDYTSLGYREIGETGYEYLLEGHDKSWIKAGPNELVRYSGLSPGSYTFKVRVANRVEDSNHPPANMNITIRKAFWMTNSFITGVIVVLISLIIFIVRHFATVRMKKKIAQLERLGEISLIRRRIAADLHDDVGSGLSKLAMMSDKARFKGDDGNEINIYLKKISAEARQMIDQLRVIVWALNPQEDKLESLISYVRHRINEFVEEYPVRYSITIPDEIPDKNITPEFKRNVYYAIREAVHNAVKHSGSGELIVTIDIEAGTMTMFISDMGTGFDREKTDKFGNGIKFMEKRINELGGKFEIESSRGRGTTIKMEIPV
ncbi:MAG: hypothetical protein JW731_07855 [Bacteroidales bacterium]|nr:hypothetical protein [Bacteroidales bacterium]